MNKSIQSDRRTVREVLDVRAQAVLATIAIDQSRVHTRTCMMGWFLVNEEAAN